MITCKICEKETPCDRLAEHSSLCKEVTKLHERLSQFRATMETHAEKAALMKNSLETYAVKEKKRQKRSHFRCNSIGDMAEATSNDVIKGYQRCNSPASCGLKPKKTTFLADCESPTDLSMSESSENGFDSPELNDTQETAPTLSTLKTLKSFDAPDSPREKKLGEEDYEKFKDQVRKSTFALRRIIAYADRINEWAFETVSMNDLDMNFKHELEILYSEIDDTKVSEFLKKFMEDFCSYLAHKAKYIRKKEELKKIDTEGDDAPAFRVRFRNNKSLTFKQKSLASLKALHGKFKEDNWKKETPADEKTPGKNNSSGLGGQFMGKRRSRPPVQTQIMGNGAGMRQDLNNNHAISPQKRMRGENMFTMFQNNLNQSPPRSSFSNAKKPAVEGLNLRESIKTSMKIVTSGFGLNCLAEKLEKVENEKNSVKSEKSAGQKAESMTTLGSLNSLASLTTLEEKASKWVQPTNPIFLPTCTVKGLFGQKEGVKKERKSKGHRRVSSIDIFKNSYKEESGGSQIFPSLTDSLADCHKEEEKRTNPRSATIKSDQNAHEDRHLCESPFARGYHSDTNHRPKRKISIGESSQVSIKDFEFIKFLGKGAYGTVWLVRKKATGDLYAMKVVDWADRFTQNRIAALKAEKDIYEVLQGDFVVKAIWTFHYNNFICFVTEYMIGGDFNKFLEDMGRLEEDQARFYLGELILAIESLHNLGIVHRDLKPDNILIDNKGHIRLTDFGLSDRGLSEQRHNATPSGRKSHTESPCHPTEELFMHQRMQVFSQLCDQPKDLKSIGNQKVKFHMKPTTTIFECLHENEEDNVLGKPRRSVEKRRKAEAVTSPIKKKLNKMVGTPDYMSPEIINPEKFGVGTYNEKSIDWWSVGVIFYQFIVGIPTFCGETIEEVFDNIDKMKIEWPEIGYEEDCMSPEAADLIKKLLHPNPNQRLGARGVEEVKNHPFFKSKNFKWDNPKTWEPPIVPYVSEDLDLHKSVSADMSSKDKEKDKFHMIFNNNSNGRKLMKSKTIEFVDLGDFQMRRVDVLDKLNQEAFLKIQKQKSATLCNV